MAKRQGTPLAEFDSIQARIGRYPQNDEITDSILILATSCIEALESLPQQELISKVPGKSYFAFTRDGARSRAVNKALYANMELVEQFLNSVKNKTIVDLSPEAITKACYTLIVSLACVVDLTNPGDKQTPGTYFQYLVTHLITRTLAANPTARVKVKIEPIDIVTEDLQPRVVDEISLTMDLVLDLGEGKPKYHIAIKNSTRERASELWAHQRILDVAFASEKYIGIFVGLAETKLDHRSLEVVEI